MSRKKVHSQGNIPFSWEDKPGVSKVTHYDDQCPLDIGFYALNKTPPPPPDEGGSKTLVHDKKVPPPPPCTMQLRPKRSTSLKGLTWWQEDPFLAAYKECTKGGGNGKWSSEQGRKTDGSKVKKKKIFPFSCKSSCDVRDDNLAWLSNLPPIPKDRLRGRRGFL